MQITPRITMPRFAANNSEVNKDSASSVIGDMESEQDIVEIKKNASTSAASTVETPSLSADEKNLLLANNDTKVNYLAGMLAAGQKPVPLLKAMATQSAGKETLLYTAIVKSQIDVAKALLPYVKPQEFSMKFSPLKIASDKGFKELIPALAELEKNTVVQNQLVEESVRADNPEQLKLYLEKGFTPTGEALLTAVAGRKFDSAKLLVEKGAKDSYALVHAIDWSNLELVKLMGENGFNLQSTLHVLCRKSTPGKDDKAIMEYIFSKDKGMINARSGKGDYEMTPLMLAAENERQDLADVLLTLGADPTLKDSKGRTAYKIAKENGNSDMKELLKTNGAGGESFVHRWIRRFRMVKRVAVHTYRNIGRS